MKTYDIGDKLYAIYLAQEEYNEPCKVCQGKGTITIEIDGINQKVKYECPECHGQKYFKKLKPQAWMLVNNKKQKITSISIDEKGPIYFFNCNGYRDVFNLKKEALAEIDKRNKELNK